MNSNTEHINSLKAQGFTLLRQHRLAEAKAIFTQVCEINSEDADAWYRLSSINGMLGNIGEAENCCRHVIALQPEHSEAHLNLGNVLYHQGKYDEAMLHYKTALRYNPDLAAVCNNNLGILFKATGRLHEATSYFHEALRLNPNIAEAHINLGNIYSDRGLLDPALTSFQEALRLDPRNAMAHNSLGNLLKTMGRIDDAIARYQEALRLNPNLAEAHNNLGSIIYDRFLLDESLQYFKEALRLKPDMPSAFNNMGNVYTRQGKHEEALACFREALRLDPNFAAARSNLLFMLCYRSDYDVETLFAEHVRWGEMHGRSAADLAAHNNPPAEDRRLRIGYVSADFRNHPVGYFIEQVLAHHDKSRVEVYCYSNQSIDDDMTARLRLRADHWRDIVGLADETVARHISQDGIDILVDLAGHTSGNRLLTFALKPAPVQVTWMSYIATTGLKAIDYIIGDRYVIRPGEEHYYVERVVRLPNAYLCFSPPALVLETSPLKASSRNGITFGCFNNTAKLTLEVITVWAKLLRALPGSRLFLKSSGLGDEIARNHYRSLFAKHGIQSERLRFADGSPRKELLAAYHEVDIALDPFPYNGGTTTVEALWMGVPVISLRGNRFVSRVGESFLTAAGLGEYIADSEEEYIAKAMALAADLPRLAELRSRLRPQLLNSPLCDGPSFTRDLEAAYRTMWKTWCHTQGPSPA